MGKQNRRKRRNHRPSGAVAQDDDSQNTSTLIKRIRHADPSTRHAALAATSATLFDPEMLQRSNYRSIHVDLLQAVRERIMDDDLECAQVAAGCLANYVSIGSNASKNESLTRGWTIVLLGRLQQCHQALVPQQENKRRRQWWAVTVQCLHALCALVEVNPQALDLLTPQSSTLFGTLLGLLLQGQNELDSKHAVATSTKKEEDEEEELEWIQNVTIYAARTLHSALDDNVDLLEPWLGNQNGDTKGINLLQSSCTHGTLPAAARLHSAGTLVTMRQLIVVDQPSCWDTTSVLQQICVETVIPVLQQYLDYRPNVVTALLQKVVETRHLLEKEVQDSKLEKEVIQTVKDRKEPARLIARRQKKQKEEEEEAKKKNATEDMEHDDKDKGDDDETEDGENEKKETERTNRRQDMEKARQAWRAALLPLQLALEISANMTSGSLAGTMQMDENAMEGVDMDWGPDQEAQLLERAQQELQEESNVLSPLDAALVEALVEKGLPDGLVVLLKSVCTPLVLQSSPSSEMANTVPEDVAEELADLQSKCGGCIGNCLGNLASWRASDPVSIWKELVQALQLLMSLSPTSSGTEGICNAMVVALRSRPLVRSQMQEGDLELLVKLLQVEQHPTLQRDAACMLGILCSTEPHSTEINTKICSSLLSTSPKASAMVHSEVLNALMDIYGDDDVHADVFDSQNVLGYFQRTVPVLKKRINAERNQYPEEEVDQWKETTLNASRFIQYKKGQL